ncbi:MAG: hypothetical protein ACPG4T_10580, partial [Nannocystaceae bacterium]
MHTHLLDRGRSLLACACLLLATLLFMLPQQAQADRGFGVVTLDLRPEVGDVPTHLCVVSQAPGPRTRRQLKDLVVAGDGGQWRLRPQAWGGAANEQTSCEGPAGECLPQVELPATADRALTMPVACTTDALLPPDVIASEPRMLVMMLEHLEGSPPVIESLKLAGGVATVGVEADLRRIVVTARSLGGHYLAQRRSQRAEGGSAENKLLVVPLQPRCQWIDLTLPYGRLRARDRSRLDAYVHGQQLSSQTCVGPMQGTKSIQLRVPRVDAGDPGSLEVVLRPGANSEEPARFGAAWVGPWPAKAVRLHATQISLVWRPPACVVADDFCPRVSLESGVSCTGSRVADACHYLCPGDADQHGVEAIEPPLTVHFEKDAPRQRWSEILTRVGQPLSSYVPGDKVVVHANIGHWERNTPGARVTEIAFLGDDGSVRKFPLRGRDTVEVPLPAATCGPIRYRLIGDRKHIEQTAEIQNGQIMLASPGASARILTFNLSLLQGGSWAISPGAPDALRTPAYFIGQGQLAANFRPRNPKYSRFSGELRLGGAIGQWGFYGADTLSDDPRSLDRKLPWIRFMFEPAMVVDI